MSARARARAVRVRVRVRVDTVVCARAHASMRARTRARAVRVRVRVDTGVCARAETRARAPMCAGARVCGLVSDITNVGLCNCTEAKGVPGGQRRRHESATGGLQETHPRKQLQIGGR